MLPAAFLMIDLGMPVAFSMPDVAAAAASATAFPADTNRFDHIQLKPIRLITRSRRSNPSSQNCKGTAASDEAAWEACKGTLSAFSFSIEEQDKILAKAFGHINSPYWSEERQLEVPNNETVCTILDYLRSLGLSDDDLSRIISKFPEVLGCSLEKEIKNNVQILAKDWGIDGKSLRNLLLRNPKVLGYNIDCKGDCMAQCTRCWARF